MTLKCSPGEILAKNCLDHVICPLYKEIGQMSRSKGLGFCHMLLLEIGLGLGLESDYRVIQGHLENRFKKSRDSRV